MIQVHSVSKTIGKNQVLNDVNLLLQGGCVTGFQGINGSGKTMLMRIIAGLVHPTEGEVVIDGKRLGKDIACPQSMGLLIESPSFLDGYTGFTNLQMLASLRRRVGDEEIIETLERVGLNPDDKRRYRAYSLGMKQRLGIAAAVMERPDVVLLDEPTNALDESGLFMLREIILAQKARGACVVVASHEKEFLYAVVDNLYLFDSGCVCEEHESMHAHGQGEIDG